MVSNKILWSVFISVNMPLCGVVGCSSRPGVTENVSFFKTPKIITNQGTETYKLSEERRRLWKRAVNRKDLISEEQWDRMIVCSKHFVNGVKAYLHLKVSPSWLPTLDLGYTDVSKSMTIACIQRSERARNIERKRKEAVAVDCLLGLKKLKKHRLDSENENMEHDDEPFDTDATNNLSVEADSETNGPSDISVMDSSTVTHDVDTHSVEVQTDMTAKNINQIEDDNRARLLEAKVTVTVRDIYSMETYDNSSDKVSLYTGLPNVNALRLVYSIVEEHLPNVSKSLTKEQQFLLCLVKLRQNYLLQDMAFQLNVSLSTVQRSFHSTLDVLYARLNFLIFWPERENLQVSMPMCFRESFGTKVAVIIDCFELYSETPSGAMNKVYTYSNYKRHQTVKYLIGIAPQGVVTFITPGWGGRTSDKHIVEKSGFLDNLHPGDIVMADRGFTIKDDVSFFQAELVIPDFTNRKKQLNPLEVENTRKIASVRNHVERVIGLVVRKFRIFDSNIPIEYMKLRKGDSVPTVDKIVQVACCLSNLCSSIVPLE